MSEGLADILLSLIVPNGHPGLAQFELHVSPPRTVLKETSSLSQAGLVPAALVYVSWENMPPEGELGREGGTRER